MTHRNEHNRESGVERWKDVASNLDSHKTSALRTDLGMASCSLWEPTEDEIQRLRLVAEEENLSMSNEASGVSVAGGTSFTVRENDTETNPETEVNRQ